MKFINLAIDLGDNTKPNDSDRKLSLAGLEVNSFIDNAEVDNLVIKCNPMTNMVDVFSVVNFVRKTSSLSARPLIDDFCKISDFYCCFKLSTFSELRLYLNAALSNICTACLKKSLSSTWLQNYLIINDVKPRNLFNNLLDYMYLQWNQDMASIDEDKTGPFLLRYSFFQVEKKSLTESSVDAFCVFVNKKLQFLKYENNSLSVTTFSTKQKVEYEISSSLIVECDRTHNPKYANTVESQSSLKACGSSRYSGNASEINFISTHQKTAQVTTSFIRATTNKSSLCSQVFNSSKRMILKQKTLQSILGLVVKNGNFKPLYVQEILILLNQLGFFVNYIEARLHFVVQIPSSRQGDLQRPIDVVEEVGRTYGFNKFASRLFLSPNTSSHFRYSNTKKKQSMRQILRNLGLNEVLSYSLLAPLQICAPSQVALCNPLTEDQLRLRDSLAVQLLKVQQYNLKHGFRDIQIFEIGKVFKNIPNTSLQSIFLEDLRIAGLISNSAFSRESWHRQSYALGWSHAKGMLEEFFEKLHIETVWSQLSSLDKPSLFAATENLLSLKQSASVRSKINNQEIGIFGRFNDSYSSPTYLFELNMASLIQSSASISHESHLIHPYSNYPILTRDISLTLKKLDSVCLVKKRILSLSSSVESVQILDEYKSSELGYIKKITFRITCRSKTRTLNRQDVNYIDAQLSKLLNYYDAQSK